MSSVLEKVVADARAKICRIKTEKMADGGQITIESVTKNGDDDDSGITMIDVLEEEQELEEDANAVLGGSDDQNCTYPSGYAKRQALYACKTCAEKSQHLAGVCLACSYACHEGHRLYELYTKRKFRCDCGNSKFQNNPCKLYPDKEPLNIENNYNHNFEGVYCTCARPYPDPDDDIEDEMIQCIICEDWYHRRHLGTPVPPNDEYGEMICGHCMSNCKFLYEYASVIAKDNKGSNDAHKEIVNSDLPSDGQNLIVSGISLREEHSEIMPNGNVKLLECKLKEKGFNGYLESEVRNVKSEYEDHVAVFLPDGWRQKLCRCTKCKDMYVEKKVLFLLDDEDTVHSYEEQGKAKNDCQSRYDQGMQALSQMDRIRQVEAIHEYNDMKCELKEFLRNFVEKKKVVRKEDIEEFFSQMQARKRQRLEISIPHFCR